jgi:hypothetical protein
MSNSSKNWRNGHMVADEIVADEGIREIALLGIEEGK